MYERENFEATSDKSYFIKDVIVVSHDSKANECRMDIYFTDRDRIRIKGEKLDDIMYEKFAKSVVEARMNNHYMFHVNVVLPLDAIDDCHRKVTDLFRYMTNGIHVELSYRLKHMTIEFPFFPTEEEKFKSLTRILENTINSGNYKHVRIDNSEKAAHFHTLRMDVFDVYTDSCYSEVRDLVFLSLMKCSKVEFARIFIPTTKFHMDIVRKVAHIIQTHYRNDDERFYNVYDF